jgi:hypothetical protein
VFEAGVVVPCTNVGSQDSTDWTVDYVNEWVEWVWNYSCTPSRHVALRWLIKTDIINSKWQWIHYLAGVERNRTNELDRANAQGVPTTPSNSDWVNNIALFGKVDLSGSVLPTPWPP